MSDKTATGLVRDMIGKTYRCGPYTITNEEVIKYAEATNDPNPWYIDVKREGGVVMPPIFPVKVLKEVFFHSLLDSKVGVNFLRLVHASQDMTIEEFIRPGDVIETTGEIIGMDEKRTGDLYTVKYECLKEGRAVVKAVSSFFIRLPKDKIKPAERKPRKPAPPAPEVIFEQTMTVDADQTVRYGDASGDNNPIHIDDKTAKMAGLPGIILQGLCTMAFASQAVVKNVLGGDPNALKRISVQFSSMVRPGDVLTTKGWLHSAQDGCKTYGYAMFNQDGVKVLNHGIAEV